MLSITIRGGCGEGKSALAHLLRAHFAICDIPAESRDPDAPCWNYQERLNGVRTMLKKINQPVIIETELDHERITPSQQTVVGLFWPREKELTVCLASDEEVLYKVMADQVIIRVRDRSISSDEDIGQLLDYYQEGSYQDLINYYNQCGDGHIKLLLDVPVHEATAPFSSEEIAQLKSELLS